MNTLSDFFRNITRHKKDIFIVEDNEVYAKALQTFIQSHFSEIKETKIFNIGEICLTEMHRKPNIVILDYFLNSKFLSAYNGLEIIKRIKAQTPETNIIVLSAQEKNENILEAIKQYDCSYVYKNEQAFTKVEKLIKEIFSRENSPVYEPVN